MSRYSFSGHESFYCKSLWLKKGYDFLSQGNSFLDKDAVVKLGVGKNMVSSIRFWLKAFGLTQNDFPTQLASYILDSEKGQDPYCEDANTLWLLHYSLIRTQVASLYHLLFIDYQREKKEFDKEALQSYIRRRCNVPEQKNVYNENTVRKDIHVLLHNYISPDNLKSLEDFSALLIPLNVLQCGEKEVYSFRPQDKSSVNFSVILYAMLDIKEDNTLSIDKIQNLSYILGLSVSDFIEMVRDFEDEHPKILHYSDNSGIKNIQFLCQLDKFKVLDEYYNTL